MLEIIAYIAYFMSVASWSGEPINRAEIFCTAQTVYHEARGEPVMGQIAVAAVIKNRIESGRYPNTACEVVHAPRQFTNLQRHGFVAEDKDAWHNAIEAAVLVHTGFVDDPTHGALNYYAARGPNAIPNPWPSMTVLIDIGNHRFKR